MVSTRVATVLGMFLAFLGPLMAAYFSKEHPDFWYDKKTNQGQLISPVIPIEEVGMQFPDKKWRLVYLTRQPCAAVCEARLHDMVKIQAALNLKGARLQNWVVLPQNAQDKKLTQLIQNRFPTVRRGNLHQTALEFERFYLVDPQGNLMMYYPENTIARSVLRDLEKLIRV